VPEPLAWLNGAELDLVFRWWRAHDSYIRMTVKRKAKIGALFIFLLCCIVRSVISSAIISKRRKSMRQWFGFSICVSLFLLIPLPALAVGALSVTAGFDMDRDEDADGTDLWVMTTSTGTLPAESAASRFERTHNGRSAVLTPKVMVINFDPVLENYGSLRLTEHLGWNAVGPLVEQYILDIAAASGGLVNYVVVETHEVDAIPIKEDGFQYTDETYLTCQASGGSACHSADVADYDAILSGFDVCTKLNNGEIDEIWLFGGPWFGLYESRLAGPGAFWYNSSPLEGTGCDRLLPIMGFNYERGSAEMLHSFGHRAEASMTHVFGSWDVTREPLHDWDLFGHNVVQTSVGDIFQCGSVHYPPNGTTGYDYDNSEGVESGCDDWLNYPDLTGSTNRIGCEAWGCDQHAYLQWWLGHLPRKAGLHEGKLLNWWAYIVGQRYDEIFPRVTDVSSEYSNGWADLVLDGASGDCNRQEWATRGEPSGWIEIAVNDDVAAISIYDRACAEQVTKGHLEFDNGTTIPFGPLADDGLTATRLEVNQPDVAWVRIYIDESTGGANPGLGEVSFEYIGE
jgi:hypothetical protein